MLRQGAGKAKKRTTLRNWMTNPDGLSLAGVQTTGNQTVSLVSYPGIAPRQTAFRVTPNSASFDTFLSIGGDSGGLRLGMRARKTYTVSAYLYVNAVQSGSNVRSRTISFFYKDSTGAYIETKSAQAPNVVGSTRLSITVAVPTGATEIFIRFYNGSNVATETVVWGSIMLTEGSKVVPYYDGNSPGFRWEGTPSESKSVGYPESPQKVTNLCDNPTLVSTSLWNGQSLSDTAARVAITDLIGAAWAWQGTSDGSASSRLYYQRGQSVLRLTPGRVHGLSIWTKIEAGRVFRAAVLSADGQTTYNSVAGQVGTGRWQEVRVAWSTTDEVGIRAEVRLTASGLPATLFMVTKLMIVDDLATLPEAYSDGDTPGWIWLGAQGTSQSVGYPYTLKSVAGIDPYLEAYGTEITSRSDAIGPTEDRTLFSVYDISALSLYPTLGALRNADDTNQATILYGHNTIDRIFGRVQLTGSNVQDLSVQAGGVRTNGRHVGGITTSNNVLSMNVFGTSLLSAGLKSTSGTISASLRHPVNQLGAASTSNSNPVYSVAYRGNFPAANRDAVVAWLANKYGLAA